MTTASSSAALSLRDIPQEKSTSNVARTPRDEGVLEFRKWARDRRRSGSVADLARRMYEANITLEEAYKSLEKCLVLEALMANKGVQLHAANSLGCHRNQLRSKVRRIGLTARSLRSIARALVMLPESANPLHPQQKVVEGK